MQGETLEEPIHNAVSHLRIQRGAGDPDPLPLKKHKNIGFLSNAGPDPLKNYNAT